MNTIKRAAANYGKNVKLRFNSAKPFLEYCVIGAGAGTTGIGTTLLIAKGIAKWTSSHPNSSLTGTPLTADAYALVASGIILASSILAAVAILLTYVSLGTIAPWKRYPQYVSKPPQQPPAVQP